MLLFATVFAAGTFVLLELGARWSQRWAPDVLRRSGIYAYRADLVAAAATSRRS